jgi:hypothetical protein
MNVILTSDFPAAAHPLVVERMKAVAPQPRIAWVAAETAGGHAQFDQAAARFRELGLDQPEYCDIDEQKDEVQLAYLYEFDIVCLSGVNPLVFRYNMLRTGLSGRLRQCASLERLIVTASGGSLLLTPNVSLYRLQSESVEAVLETRGRFDGMSAVAYEVLPHLNRWDREFLDKVSDYSSRIDNDVIGVPDGAAVFAETEHAFGYVGAVVRYRQGVREEYAHLA